MLDWIDTQLADAIALTTLHSLWQGLLIVCLTLVCVRSKYFQVQERAYRLFATALGVLFLCSGVTFFLVSTTAGNADGAMAQGPLSWTLVSQGLPGAEPSWWNVYWKEIVALSWAVGVLFCLLRFLLSSARVILQRRAAKPVQLHWQHRLQSLARKFDVRKRITLLTSHRGDVPFVFGVFRPVIIFPAIYFNQLTPAQVESILLHELAHIRRNDFIINIVQMVVESLLFFNPAVWWLSSRIRMHREFCCDDYVQSRVESRKSYLEALYNVARISLHRTTDVGSVALFNNHSELVMRVKRMLNQPHTRTSLRPLITGGIGAVLVFGLLAFQMVGLSSDQPEEAAGGSLEELVIPVVLPELAPLVPTPVTNNKHLGPLTSLAALDEIDTWIGKPLPVPAFVSKRDTVPDDKRVIELEAEMEAKEKEMDALAREMEESMDEDLEVHMEKMEEVARKLEEMHEARAEEIEQKIENSEDMRRLEELSEQLEVKMEKIELDIDERIDHAQLEQLEREMELKMKDLEMRYDSIPPEDRQRYMQEIQEQMLLKREELIGPIMEQVREQMEAIRDPEIQKIHEEMAQLQRRISETHQHVEIGEMPEMQELHEQLREMESKLHEDLTPIREQYTRQMAEKAREMEELARELQELHQERIKEHQHQNKESGKR